MDAKRLRLVLLSVLIVVVFAVVYSQEVDPCNSYKVINNPYRSTKYKLVTGDVAICDDKLTRGWYRFTSIVGGMIPETKPSPLYCGTVAPIWIRGSHPTTSNETVQLTECTNQFGANEGCSYARQISVKKCAGNFYVYHLQRSFGCAMAYCAGDQMPCPKGKSGIVPDCKVLQQVPFPHNLLPRPTITWMDNPDSFSMVCQFDQFPCWENVSVAVEWFADGRSVKNETIEDLQINCKKKRGELAPIKDFKTEERLRCRIRMKYNTHPKNNWTATYKESDDYYIGIKVSPSHVFVKKCPPAKESYPIEVNVRPTIPIKPIWGLFPEWTIFIPNKRLLKLLFNECTFQLSTKHIKTGKNITIAAACSNVNTGQNREVLDYEFYQIHAHKLWSKYKSTVRVSINNTEQKMCHAVSDPHYNTFDRRRYDFYEHGDYVLYSNPERNFEIHTRLWVCWGVSCNCGLAIREGNDVIIISACNSELEYKSEPTILRTKVRSKGRLARGTHIYRSRDGFATEVILPSGARIRVERDPMWLSVFLYAPIDDHDIAGGLCGNANGKPDDDFWNGGKSGKVDGTELSFARSWKLPNNESYFDTLPQYVKVPSNVNNWCDCRERVECTDNRVRRTDSPSKGKKDLTPGLNADQDRRRRSIDDYVYSDEFVMNNVEKSFFIDKDDVEFTTKRIRERRAVLSKRISKENATNYCQGIIEESKAGKMCKNVPGFNLTFAMHSCVEDLEITGDVKVAGAAFNSMKQGCEEAALSNITLYKQDARGVLQPPKEIEENLCSNDCSSHGNCTNGTCICDKGYTSDDCSMSINAIPALLGIYDGGLCDIRLRPCTKIDLFGENFLNSKNLTCHIEEFKVVSSSWVPKSHIVKLPGQMIDVFGVRCQLPDPPTKISDYDSDGTPAGGLWISVSNDGEHKSQRKMRFTSYDSVCMACNKTGNCTLKENTCLIRGHCFASTQRKPQDWCQQCIPDNSQNSWTRRKNNRAPSFEQSQSTRYAIAGENLPLQLKATDPDNRPVTYSLISSTASSGYTFSSTGLLQWNVTSKEDFTVRVTDECNATDTITITISIVKCQCKHGGLCFPHPYYPRGSGQYSCECPKGISGDKCQTNIDDCVSVNCGNGTCIDGINNYTCRCNPGFAGFLCNQTIYKCTNQSCFTGVQCTETASGITCGPCPIGLSGDGKSCSAPTTTSSPTTDAATNVAPTTTNSPTTGAATNAPTTTNSPTTDAATNAPTTTASPTTDAATNAPTTTSSPTTDAATNAPTTTSSPTTDAATNAPTTTTSPTTDAATNVPTTTSSPTTVATTKVKAELSIKMEWDGVYRDRESQGFLLLASQLKIEIWNSYSGLGNLEKIRIISFRRGSIIVEFELVFNSKPSDPLQPLKKSIEDGKMGTFAVDPKSLKIKHEATDEPKPPAKKDLTLILPLVCLGVLIFIVATVMLVYKFNNPLRKQIYRISKRDRSSQQDENGKEILEMEEPTEGPIQNKKAEEDMEAGSINAGFQ